MHKENINLSRFVGFPEDLEHVRNHEMKIENKNNTGVASTVTPTRESRKKK